MLRHNINSPVILDKVRQMDPLNILQRVKALELKEYGTYHLPIAKKWESAMENKQKTAVVGALNNSDSTVGMLGFLLKENPMGVLVGLGIAAHALGTDCVYLYLPASFDQEDKNHITDLALEISLDLQIETGFVDMRNHQGHVFHHLETLSALTDLFCDAYVPSVILAVNGQQVPPYEIPYGSMTIKDFLDLARKDDLAIPDISAIKAITIGNQLYSTDICDQLISDDFCFDNGLITIYDHHTCIPKTTYEYLSDCQSTSCGTCTFCREGLYQLTTICSDIISNKALAQDLNLLSELAVVMKENTMCSVGYAGANTLIYAMDHFKDEWVNHIKTKVCKANICTAFLTYYVDPNKCQGCTLCLTTTCPVSCIDGDSGYISMIDEFSCTKCGLCLEKCPNHAILTTTGRLPKLPNRLTKVGRFKKR